MSPKKESQRLWPTPISSDQYYAQVGDVESSHDIGKGYLRAEVLLRDKSPLSPEASPASPTRLRESVRELLTSVTSGQSSGVSLAKLDPDGSWVKTYQEYFQATLDGSLEKWPPTWPKWGTLSGGVLTEQLTWGHYTEETECSLWATPNTLDGMPPKSESCLWKEATQDRRNRSKPANLRDQVTNKEVWESFPRRNYNLWPTAQSRDWKGPQGRSYKGVCVDLPQAVRMWPTPTGRDYKDTGDCENVEDNGLLGRVVNPSKESGSLNPLWVEWLQGFPPVWTDLNASETP